MSSRLLIDEAPLLVLPGLAKVVGLNEAIVLQQVHYWLNPKFNKNYLYKRHWVWKTYKQWAEEFSFWGDKTVRRTVDQLEARRILLTFKKTAHFKTLKYYSIDYERLNQLMAEVSTSEDVEASELPAEEETLKLSPCQDTLSCGEELEESDIRSCKVSPNSDSLDSSSSPEEGSRDRQSAVASPGLPGPSSLSLLKPAEHKGFSPNGQLDHPDVPVWAKGEGQTDQEEEVNLTNSYTKDKTTVKKITPPLPSPPERKNLILAISMVSLWNKSVQAKLQKEPVRLSKPSLLKLTPLLKEHFGGDLAQWKSYCDHLAGSRFLMTRQESGFQVNFHWATKAENIAKVLKGAYYDKPLTEKEKKIKVLLKTLPWQEYLALLKDRCAKQHPSPKWAEICQNLAKKLGQYSYNWLLGEAVPKSLDPDNLKIAVPSSFQAEYLENKFGSALQGVLENAFPTLTYYRIVADPSLKKPEEILYA